MTFEPLQPLQLKLTPVLARLARRECESLPEELLQKFDEGLEMALDSGYLLAELHLIDREMRRIGMQRVELAGCFAAVTPSAVSKWFSDCSISSTYLAKLRHLPEFERLSPTENDVTEHQYRCGITWSRSVLSPNERVRMIKFDELHYLSALHALNHTDVSKALDALPKYLVQWLGRRSEGWLYTLQLEWGRPYRMFVTHLDKQVLE